MKAKKSLLLLTSLLTLSLGSCDGLDSFLSDENTNDQPNTASTDVDTNVEEEVK